MKMNEKYEEILKDYELAKQRANTFYDLYKTNRAVADSYKSQLIELATPNLVKELI